VAAWPASRDLGTYCPGRVITGFPVPSTSLTHSAVSGDPFFPPVATPVGFDGSAESFSAIGISITTLTHSNNVRSFRPTVFAFCSLFNREHRASLGFASGCVPPVRPDRFGTSLAACLPSSLDGKERPFPGKAVTSASSWLPRFRAEVS